MGLTGPPPAPPTPEPRAVLRFGSWEAMHASGLTWEQLHLSGLTWEGLIWLPEPAPEHVSPTRVGLNGARSATVGVARTATAIAVNGSRRSLAQTGPPTATAVALGASRRSLVQTGPPGGRQHGRPGP